MSRCYTIQLPDGTQAIVRTARGRQPSEADLKEIEALRKRLISEPCKHCGHALWKCICGDAA